MIELLKKIDNEGIVIEVIEGELKLFSNNAVVDESLLQEIKTHKTELTNYLSRSNELSIQGEKYFEIPLAEPAESYPVSNAQYRLWAASQLEENSVAYNISNQIVLDGAYNIDNFVKAVHAAIERHEILRTVYKLDEEGDLRQYILSFNDLGFNINYEDYRDLVDPRSACRDFIQKDLYRPFDFEKGPLLRASILQFSDSGYIFYYSMHHIISDGWSMNVLSQDVMTYYTAFESNKTPELSPLRIQYKDYASWQLSELVDPASNAHKEYWLSKLEGELPTLELPTLKRRPGMKTYKGYRLGMRISPQMTSTLRKFTSERGGSLFIGALAVLKALLYRYTSEKDVIIGNPVAGREHPDLEDQIGFYLNVLALRNQVDPNSTFLDLYNQVKASTLEAYKHQIYPFDQVINDLNIKRDISRNPVFDILLDYEGISNTGLGLQEIEGVQEIGFGMVKFDLEFDLLEFNGGIDIKIGYNTEVYDRAIIEQFTLHFKELLEIFLQNPESCIGTVSFLNKKEKNKILYEFNPEILTKPVPFKNIIEVFQNQVKKNPEASAVIFENESLTYRELDRQSDLLAHHLKEQGVERGEMIPLCMDRSLELLTGILGILKAGGAYVPIDLNCPPQRLDFILEDIECSKFLTHTPLKAKFQDYEDDFDLVYVDELLATKSKEEFSELDVEITAKQLAYVIYTSGTTGVPKGVLVEHQNIASYLVHQSNYFGVNEKDTFLLFANIAFDASVEQLFLPILNGARLVIPKTSDLLDYQKFASLISDFNITHLHATPSFLRNISLEDPGSLKRLVSAGEAFDPELHNTWKGKVELYNKYGPTEGTISATEYKLPVADFNPFSIGYPIGDTRCYVLSENNMLQPLGVVGEIAIAGSGVARGYLNREDLTNERFIANPFLANDRIYKTGDKGCWLPNGSIAFFGRTDDQIKIRGHRVELGEIESVLRQLHNVENAAVLAIGENNESKKLVAYIVTNELTDATSVQEGLMLLLEEQLPSYMVPEIYVPMEEMPINSSGKIDRKALPVPEVVSRHKTYAPPSTDMEKQLVEIWQDILKVDKIGIDDDFFALGGNSLNAIKINYKINQALNLDIEIKSLFLFKTIRELASQIEFSESQKALKSNKKMIKTIEL